MKTYTIIAYIVPDGASYSETVLAKDATKAALLVKKTFGEKTERALLKDEFEVIAAIEGCAEFCAVDHKKLNLFP